MLTSGPENIMDELSKWDGIDLHGKGLVIENVATKSPPKSIESSKSGNGRPAAVMEKHPENQGVFSSPAIILGTKSFSKAVRTRRDQRKLFNNGSITKGSFLKGFT